MYFGAYNYLDLERFLEHLNGIDWPTPEWVQLFVMEQHHFTWRIIDILDLLTTPERR